MGQPTGKRKVTILLTVGKHCLCVSPFLFSNLKQIFSKMTIAIIFEGLKLKIGLGKGSFPQNSVLERGHIIKIIYAGSKTKNDNAIASRILIHNLV